MSILKSSIHTSSSVCASRKILYGWGQSMALPLRKGHLNRVFQQPVRLNKEQDYALPEDQGIDMMATGWGHSLIATNNNRVYAFGLNESGQLGTSQSGNVVMKDQSVKFLACGREHSHIVTENKQGTSLYSFGNNMYGQLGLGKSKRTSPGKMVSEHEPKLVQHKDLYIKQIVCGLDHTILATEDHVYGMGWSADGQLGQGKEDKDRPSKLPLVSCVKKLASSTDFTLALSHDGKLWTWGNSEYGQGIQGKTIDRILEPLEIKVQEEVVDIAAGGPFSVLLTKDGRVHTCGYGALGLGENSFQTLEMTTIEGLRDIRKVFATTDYAAAITDSGELYTWGLNGPSGRLGLGHFEHSFQPKRVDLNRAVLDVSLGTNHALAICIE